MVVKYKRKFRVSGNTIQDCWSFRKKCQKQYHYPEKPPCLRNKNSWRRDESKCPFPINRPKEYIVSEMEDGTWRCSCPIWKFRRKQCHHIDKAKANPKEYEIAVEFTGRTTDVFDKLFKT